LSSLDSSFTGAFAYAKVSAQQVGATGVLGIPWGERG